MVSTFSIGCCGAIPRTTRVAAGASAAASPAARITRPPANTSFLREGPEHHRKRLGVEPAVLGVADDADHGAPVARDTDELEHLAGPGHSPADRILAGEELVGQGLVEDDDQRAARPVGALRTPGP